MYPKETNYENMEVDRAEFIYEGQIQKLHKLADILYGKVAHISCEGLKSIDGEVKNPPHSTRLNRDIQDVISHFETIIGNIQN